MTFLNPAFSSEAIRLCIRLLLEPVADDIGILGDLPSLIQLLDDLDVIRIRGLQVDIVLQRLFHDKGEMRTLRTIAIEIFTFIAMLFDRMRQTSSWLC
jgi:hypothetical protein